MILCCMNKKNVSALILVAGISKRMKMLKAFLAFDDKTTFFGKIVNTYISWGCREIVVVTNKQFNDSFDWSHKLAHQLTFVTNDHIHYERFYSIKTGLNAMKDTDFCFLQNIDNPFVNHQILDQLYLNRTNDAYVVPVYKHKGGHPILLNKKSISHVKTYIENSANLREVLGELNSKRVVVDDESVLVNINNPEEYRELIELK